MGRLDRQDYCSGHPTALTRAFDSLRAAESEDCSVTATAAKLAGASIIAVRIAAGRACFAKLDSVAVAVAATVAASTFTSSFFIVAGSVRNFTKKLDQQRPD